jgi:hypothetical protein
VAESRDGFIGEYQDQALGIFYINGDVSSIRKIRNKFFGGTYVTGFDKSPGLGEGRQEGPGSGSGGGSALASLA